MSFSFGTPSKTPTSFTLPTSTPATTATATPGGFQFTLGGGDTNKPTPTLFSTPTPAGGLSFGPKPTGPPGTTAAAPLSFGAPASAPLQFGTGTASTVAAVAPIQFGPMKTTAAVTGTAQAAGALQFGGKTSFTPLGGGGAAPAAVTTGLSSGLSLGTSTSVTASSAAPKLSFGLSPATTAPAATSAPSLSLGTSLGTTSTTTLSLTTTTPSTTASSIVPGTTSMTFAQLEDNINKWTMDLEDQGKFFINQAKQLNAWDTLLISNGESIVTLNSAIQRVKQQQSQLDQELDFVLAQQKELEELIAPLERELLDTPVTDIDRNQMYQYAEVIDSQLKQMSDDLKEIIENINETNKEEEIVNPISQISKILNAHMNSLQWIDRNSSQISSHLEQISKMQEANRRNLTLNNSSFNNSVNNN